MSAMQHTARVALARATQSIGRTGWAGVFLGVAAVVIIWNARPMMGQDGDVVALPASAVAEAPSVSAASAPPASPPARLPTDADLAHTLTQLQQIAVTHGLAWDAADYKRLPAGESTPAAVEVRCTLKGPYRKLRAALTLWLGEVPGVALRDLSMSRPNSEMAEVEARLVLAIFIAEQRGEPRP